MDICTYIYIYTYNYLSLRLVELDFWHLTTANYSNKASKNSTPCIVEHH